MKLDYYFNGLMIFFLLMVSSPAIATTPAETRAENLESRLTFLQNRLNEIEALDKSALAPSEKRLLRKEVRQIKKELAALGGGIYLSVGAILLIALLLILLL